MLGRKVFLARFLFIYAYARISQLEQLRRRPRLIWIEGERDAHRQFHSSWRTLDNVSRLFTRWV
jgi:hypothetical protein